MSEGKVPMPVDGQGSPKINSDGVSDAETQGRSTGGESGGGSYDNPHTGKEDRGESAGFEGGQSVKGYYGAGQLDGENADPDQSGAVGQGGETGGESGLDDTQGTLGGATVPTFEPEPHVVEASGRTFEVVETNGVAEAEATGKVGTDAPYEAEQKQPGAG